MRRTLASFAVAGLITAGLAAAPAPAATGSTIRTSDGGATAATITANDAQSLIVYTAGSGQRNDPSITHAFGTDDQEHLYTVHDVVPIIAGPGCVPVTGDPKAATCVLHEPSDFFPMIRLDLGDQPDRIDLAGFDEAPGSGGINVINGGAGNDVLVTPTTREILNGDAGNDTLAGGQSALGGDGNDVIIRSGGANGGAGNDRIIGSDADPGESANTGTLLRGGPGDDTITGGSGGDSIFGNSGNDSITGGRGDDEISGGPGNDTIYGNSGNDTITGGPGRDKLSGGPGRDRVSQ
jgi:Ca2+-binding RTX toxin-like protein